MRLLKSVDNQEVGIEAAIL